MRQSDSYQIRHKRRIPVNKDTRIVDLKKTRDSRLAYWKKIQNASWEEIYETAKTFLEGLGDASHHDLVSLARIEKSHTAGMMRTTKATAMAKNICSFFENNPFKKPPRCCSICFETTHNKRNCPRKDECFDCGQDISEGFSTCEHEDCNNKSCCVGDLDNCRCGLEYCNEHSTTCDSCDIQICLYCPNNQCEDCDKLFCIPCSRAPDYFDETYCSDCLSNYGVPSDYLDNGG